MIRDRACERIGESATRFVHRLSAAEPEPVLELDRARDERRWELQLREEADPSRPPSDRDPDPPARGADGLPRRSDAGMRRFDALAALALSPG